MNSHELAVQNRLIICTLLFVLFFYYKKKQFLYQIVTGDEKFTVIIFSVKNRPTIGIDSKTQHPWK